MTIILNLIFWNLQKKKTSNSCHSCINWKNYFYKRNHLSANLTVKTDDETRSSRNIRRVSGRERRRRHHENMSPRECSPRSVQRETCLAKFHSSSPIRGPMALLHPDIDSPPHYSRVRRPAGTFGRAFRSLKAARISPQNIGRIVCSRLTRSFPPLRLLFFIRASFFPLP